MSAWASPAVVPQGPGLREIMDAEEVNQTRRLADESDEALQLALRVSAVSSTPQGMACSVCTFMNEKTAATACEMCGSSLPGNSSDATQHRVSVDADLALALRLAQQEEASIQNNQNNDSLTQARADPMWQARHGVVSSDMYCQDESEGSFKLVDDVGEGNAPPVDPRAYGVEYITLEDGRIVTKHDPVINGRQNSRHAEEHLPCMGDLSGSARKGHSHKEIRLPNTAFNAMRREVKKSMDGGVKKGVAQRGRVATEQRATREGVLDLGTRQLLLKLINKGALEEITGVVNAGKEARVFYGVGNRAALLRSGGANENDEDEEEDEDQGAEGAALSWSDGEEVEEEGGGTFSRDGGDGERVVEEEAEGEAEAEDALGVVVQEAANAASGLTEEQEVEYLFQAPSHRKRAPDPSAADSADGASKAENPGCDRAEDAGETTITTTGSQLDLSELQVLVRSAKLTGERQRPSESPQEARQGATPSHPSSLPHPAAGSPSPSMGVAVKVFFTSLDQFSKRVDYINGDSRYRGRNMSRLTKRRLVTLWCDKEYRNLVRAYRSGVPCPTPLAHTGHVLLMSFLPEEQEEEVEDGTVEEQGDEVEDSSASATDALSPCAASSTASDGPPASPSSSSDAAGVLNEGEEKEGPWEWTPAPQLHQVPLAELSSKAWMRCYLQALACCRTLYQRAHLVHGDLSEYNLLLTRTTRPPKKKTEEEKGKQGREEEAGGGGGLGRQHHQRTQPRVQVIDLGQAVVRSHPHAAELLRRDLANVLAFFAKRKVPVHSLPVCEAFVKDPHALPEDGAHAHAHLTYGRAKKAAASSKEEAECGAALRSQHRGDSGDEDCVSAALDRITKGEEEIASAVRNALASVREGEVAIPGV